MDVNGAKCKEWSKEIWFDLWCTGVKKDDIPQNNHFGVDTNGNGITLKQACSKTCDQSKLDIMYRKLRRVSNFG